MACGSEENCMLETKMWETVAGGDGGNDLLGTHAQRVWKQAKDRTGQDRKRLAKEKVRKEVGQVGEAER